MVHVLDDESPVIQGEGLGLWSEPPINQAIVDVHPSAVLVAFPNENSKDLQTPPPGLCEHQPMTAASNPLGPLPPPWQPLQGVTRQSLQPALPISGTT